MIEVLYQDFDMVLRSKVDHGLGLATATATATEQGGQHRYHRCPAVPAQWDPKKKWIGARHLRVSLTDLTPSTAPNVYMGRALPISVRAEWTPGAGCS